MIDHVAALLALQAKLLTLSVVTTGSTSIAATSTGYTRSTGSFITDGFRPGMEVSSSDFGLSANNAAKTITAVTALTLTCSGCAAESAGSRTLTVGCPANRAEENLTFEPTNGEPWVEDVYLPGPAAKLTNQTGGVLEALPQYLVRVYVPQNTGIDAAMHYATGVLNHFAAGTTFTLTDQQMHVRGDFGPYASQLIRTDSGFATLTVTVPLRLWTANT